MPAPVPVPTNTLVDLEAAWLAGDTTLAALVTPTAYSKHRADGAKGMDVRISRTVTRRVSNRQVERVHTFVALITWPLVNGASSMADDQRYLGAAVDATIARVMGSAGDHTHGGLFGSVGEGEGLDGRGDSIPVDYSDPLAALQLEHPVLTATLTYSATERLTPN